VPGLLGKVLWLNNDEVVQVAWVKSEADKSICGFASLSVNLPVMGPWLLHCQHINQRVLQVIKYIPPA